MDPFLDKFLPVVYRQKNKKIDDSHYCKYNNQGLEMFTSSLYIAGLIALLFVSPMTARKYGRKASIINGVSVF